MVIYTMFDYDKDSITKDDKNALFLEMLHGYLDEGLPLVTNLANMAAIVYDFFDGINWAGFYLYQDDKLILGPFQGRPACTEIHIGKGVCGVAAKTMKSIIVPETDRFEGHIVCDSASKAEIVIPIVKDDGLFGVLDIDSPNINRFTEEDRLILQESVRLLIDILP